MHCYAAVATILLFCSYYVTSALCVSESVTSLHLAQYHLCSYEPGHTTFPGNSYLVKAYWVWRTLGGHPTLSCTCTPRHSYSHPSGITSQSRARQAALGFQPAPALLACMDTRVQKVITDTHTAEHTWLIGSHPDQDTLYSHSALNHWPSNTHMHSPWWDTVIASLKQCIYENVVLQLLAFRYD